MASGELSTVLCLIALLPSVVKSANLLLPWQWTNIGCLPAGLEALSSEPAWSERHCAVLAGDLLSAGPLVLQFEPQSGRCSVFLFQAACRHLLHLQGGSCHLFLQFPVSPELINAKLSSMWLADGRSSLENLVCQSDRDTNRFYPVNVSWTSEGALFDGSAYMGLNKSDMTFSGGITWLLRLMRKPKVQPLLEFTDCDNFVAPPSTYIQIFEYDSPNRIFVRLNGIGSNYTIKHYFTAVNQLPNDSSQWINIGFTTDPQASFWGLFYNSSILPTDTIVHNTESPDPPLSKFCLYFGRRVPSVFFEGTLRALGIANATMTEAEIRQFFDLVR